MVTKEFRELRRDRRTMAMMIVLPVVLLVVFGYAANFKVHDIPTVVVGPGARPAASSLPAPTFHVTEVDTAAGEPAAQARLRDGQAGGAAVTGKLTPYLLVAVLDLVLIIVIGMGVFGVPFAGNVAVFALGAALFLLVTLGMGILVSTVSQNQGQAIQLAFMIVLPQVLLSGLIFPVSSMAAGVRWISYLLPLTYFIDI